MEDYVDSCMARESPPRVSELARVLNVSQRSLLNDFRRLLGVRPSEYIKAYQLAACTNVSAGGDCLTASPPGTTRSGFDPFGRPQTETRADGSTTTIDYTDGAARFSDTKKAATVGNVNGTCGSGCTGGQSSLTTYSYDVFGRLVTVVEPAAGSPPVADSTSYTYDANDKLASVGQGSQIRSFTSNAFGFLTSETTPETGPSNRPGTVSYVYGSLGNVSKRTEADGSILTYQYDAAGRVLCVVSGDIGTSTCDTSSLPLYLRNYYDESGHGQSNGKLTTRKGYNWIPTIGPVVTDSFSYGSGAGRLSSQVTTVGICDFYFPATQTWTYNALGLVSAHGNPRSSGAFSVTPTYSEGIPVSITANSQGIVTAATYNPAGWLGSWTAGNSGTAVVTTIGQHATNLLSRPVQIKAAAGGTTLFDMTCPPITGPV